MAKPWFGYDKCKSGLSYSFWAWINHLHSCWRFILCSIHRTDEYHEGLNSCLRLQILTVVPSSYSYCLIGSLTSFFSRSTSPIYLLVPYVVCLYLADKSLQILLITTGISYTVFSVQSLLGRLRAFFRLTHISQTLLWSARWYLAREALVQKLLWWIRMLRVNKRIFGNQSSQDR